MWLSQDAVSSLTEEWLMNSNGKKKACLIDTTLRDGEQTPGLAFSTAEKLRLAMEMDRLGMDQIEAGVPAMGLDEKKCIVRIKENCRRSKVSTWNRMLERDIMDAMDCAPDSVHISAPVSDLHIHRKLGKDRRWLREQLKRCVSLAMDRGFAVSVGLEDASRADRDFLLSISRMLGEMGVAFIRYADTVGILTPGEVYQAIQALAEAVKPNGTTGGGTKIGIHAHDDLGMAAANSLTAVQAGAVYVDVTLSGIGERAGNCDLRRFLSAGDGLVDGGLVAEDALELEEMIAPMIRRVFMVSND
jgi:homocitrate synthase NifV